MDSGGNRATKNYHPVSSERKFIKRRLQFLSTKKVGKNAVLTNIFLTGAALFTMAALTNQDSHLDFSQGRRISFNVLAATSFSASIVTMRFALKNKGKAVHLRNLDLLE